MPLKFGIFGMLKAQASWALCLGRPWQECKEGERERNEKVAVVLVEWNGKQLRFPKVNHFSAKAVKDFPPIIIFLQFQQPNTGKYVKCFWQKYFTSNQTEPKCQTLS